MFILQLNVTVSPVPGLPEGLTYNCSFSGSGAGFPLVVPAIELEAETQYQCNITGSISDLSSIAHGMSEHTQRLIKMLDILIPCSDRFQFYQCRVRYAICYQQKCSNYLQLLSSNKV